MALASLITTQCTRVCGWAPRYARHVATLRQEAELLRKAGREADHHHPGSVSTEASVELASAKQAMGCRDTESLPDAVRYVMRNQWGAGRCSSCVGVSV